jgi:hypothetical protein
MARGSADRCVSRCHAMTIWRWERDPKLAFPPASVIHGRKYWNRNDIDTWMRRMATSKAIATEKVAAGRR